MWEKENTPQRLRGSVLGHKRRRAGSGAPLAGPPAAAHESPPAVRRVASPAAAMPQEQHGHRHKRMCGALPIAPAHAAQPTLTNEWTPDAQSGERSEFDLVRHGAAAQVESLFAGAHSHAETPVQHGATPDTGVRGGHCADGPDAWAQVEHALHTLLCILPHEWTCHWHCIARVAGFGDAFVASWQHMLHHPPARAPLPPQACQELAAAVHGRMGTLWRQGLARTVNAAMRACIGGHLRHWQREATSFALPSVFSNQMHAGGASVMSPVGVERGCGGFHEAPSSPVASLAHDTHGQCPGDVDGGEGARQGDFAQQMLIGWQLRQRRQDV